MYQVRKPELFDALPELGMGFHFGVDSEVGGGFIVLNAQYAVNLEEIGDRRVFRQLREQKVEIKTANIIPSQDSELFLKWFGLALSNHSAYRNRTKLHESPPFPLSTGPNDEFVRYSTYANDRRIGPGDSLLPGTYVTSKMDADVAKTGFGNVGRYALPNPLPAVHRFDIVVPGGTAGLVGTVAPAFGQSGGGVEIELTSGAPPGSVKKRSRMPEY